MALPGRSGRSSEMRRSWACSGTSRVPLHGASLRRLGEGLGRHDGRDGRAGCGRRPERRGVDAPGLGPAVGRRHRDGRRRAAGNRSRRRWRWVQGHTALRHPSQLGVLVRARLEAVAPQRRFVVAWHQGAVAEGSGRPQGPVARHGGRLMSQIFLLSLTAALNPTLLAATTAMLVLPNPQRLLLGYLFGALMTSITLGLVIVFRLSGSSRTTSTAQHTLNPAVDLALGALILIIAFVVGTGRDTRRRARSARKRGAAVNKAPPRWKQALSRGNARTTFVVGALLTLPG